MFGSNWFKSLPDFGSIFKDLGSIKKKHRYIYINVNSKVVRKSLIFLGKLKPSFEPPRLFSLSDCFGTGFSGISILHNQYFIFHRRLSDKIENSCQEVNFRDGVDGRFSTSKSNWEGCSDHFSQEDLS